MFEYRAIVTGVYDADTITVDIDLGFHIWARNEKIRLLGIDAPEVRGVERPQGLKSRDWLRERILEKEIVLKTHKAGKRSDAVPGRRQSRRTRKGKYGRWLGDIFIAGETVSLNRQMVDLGLAQPASY